MDYSRDIQNRLFISIFKNTEKIIINCRRTEQISTVREILEVVSILNSEHLKLIVFKVYNSSHVEDLIKKYSYLRSNIALINTTFNFLYFLC